MASSTIKSCVLVFKARSLHHPHLDSNQAINCANLQKEGCTRGWEGKCLKTDLPSLKCCVYLWLTVRRPYKSAFNHLLSNPCVFKRAGRAAS